MKKNIARLVAILVIFVSFFCTCSFGQEPAINAVENKEVDEKLFNSIKAERNSYALPKNASWPGDFGRPPFRVAIYEEIKPKFNEKTKKFESIERQPTFKIVWKPITSLNVKIGSEKKLPRSLRPYIGYNGEKVKSADMLEGAVIMNIEAMDKHAPLEVVFPQKEDGEQPTFQEMKDIWLRISIANRRDSSSPMDILGENYQFKNTDELAGNAKGIFSTFVFKNNVMIFRNGEKHIIVGSFGTDDRGWKYAVQELGIIFQKKDWANPAHLVKTGTSNLRD